MWAYQHKGLDETLVFNLCWGTTSWIEQERGKRRQSLYRTGSRGSGGLRLSWERSIWSSSIIMPRIFFACWELKFANYSCLLISYLVCNRWTLSCENTTTVDINSHQWLETASTAKTAEWMTQLFTWCASFGIACPFTMSDHLLANSQQVCPLYRQLLSRKRLWPCAGALHPTLRKRVGNNAVTFPFPIPSYSNEWRPQ